MNASVALGMPVPRLMTFTLSLLFMLLPPSSVVYTSQSQFP